MRAAWRGSWAAGALCLASVASAQEGQKTAVPEKIPLSVLYLGSSADSPDSKQPVEQRAARFRAFADFLDRHFAQSDALDRAAFQPADAEGFDVVLLDWSQQDIDLQKMAELESPLGPREEWTLPTVLLGSAGLLIAGPWELPASWG